MDSTRITVSVSIEPSQYGQPGLEVRLVESVPASLEQGAVEKRLFELVADVTDRMSKQYVAFAEQKRTESGVGLSSVQS